MDAEEKCLLSVVGLWSSIQRQVTKHGVQSVVHPMSRWLRVDHLYLHRPRLKGTWYLDTLITMVKLLLGNKCANVFTHGKYTKVVPMASQKEAAESVLILQMMLVSRRHW
jgi:hypothetical protein